MAELKAVKSIIRSLLISSNKREGITAYQLSNDYKNLEGSNIPFRKFGYQSLDTFLHSMPDTVFFTSNNTMKPVVIEDNQHISNLVAKSRKPPKQKPTYRGTTFNYHPTYNHNSSFNRYRNSNTSSSFYNRQSAYSYHNYNQNQKFNVVNYNAPTTYFYQTMPSAGNQTMLPKPQNSMASYQLQQQQACYQNQQQQLMTSYVQQQQSMASYQQQTNFNINVYPSNAPKYGNQPICRPPYTNSESSEYDFQPPPVPAVCDPTTKPPNAIPDLIDFDLEIPSNVENHQKVQVVNETLNVPDNSTSILDSSFEMQSSVAHSSLLLGEIQKGIGDIDLTSNSDFAKVSREDDTKFLSKKSAKNPFIDRSTSDPFDDITEDDIIFTLDHPPFAGEDFKIPGNKIHYQPGVQYKIFISEIHSPSKFYFHDGDQCYILDNLMEDLEHYYRKLSSHDLKFHEKRMTEGHACAAKVFDFWHRGEIVARPENGKVRIFFLDYGSNIEISVNDVKYLLTEFAKIPRQAFRGCLQGIQPADKSLFWDLDATKEMLDYVSNKPLLALCNRIKEPENVALLTVIVVKKPEEININRLLLIKGYAALAPEVMTVNGELIRGIGPMCYEYPYFETLETTDYPSYGERVAFKKKYDINFNVIEDTYLFMNSYDDVLKRDEIVKAMKLTHIPIIRKIKKYFLYKQQQPAIKIISE